LATRRKPAAERRIGWWAVVAGALLGVLGQAVVDFIIHMVGGQVSSSTAWFSGMTLVVLIVLILLIRELRDRILGLYKKTDELEQKSRFSIRYYPLDPGPDTAKRDIQAERLYAEARRVIEYAAAEDGQSRILAVNSFVEIGGQAGDDHVMQLSRDYLHAIDRVLGKVSYHRIIQLPAADLGLLPHGSIAPIVAANYREHYRNILEPSGNSRGQEAALLEAVPARYPTSYLLVQNKEDLPYGGRLIWQMHEHVDSGERGDEVQLTGLFVVVDPRGLMLRTFVEWFQELRKLTPTHRLTLQNLEEDPSAAALGNGSGDSPRPDSRRTPWRQRRA
jgi:hypothetical protein